MNEQATLDIELHPKQAYALQTPATEVLFGGSAGGGKSWLMRVAAITWALQVPMLQVYLFRRLFPDLQKNHMEGEQGFPRLLAPMIASGQCAIVRDQIRFYNGAKIFLCHCQHEKDLAKYQGADVHVLLLDELTHFTETIYRYLRGRCRVGDGVRIPAHLRGQFPRIMASSNPGGIGHHWVKAAFVDPGPYRIHTASAEDGGNRRQFIPARLTDNPSLDAETYTKQLQGLGDPLLVRAMLDGDWTVVAGAMFGSVWRRDRHIVPPFPIPEGWKLWRGADDGFGSPASCHWFTQDPDIKTIYVIGELYRAGMLPDDFAERVLKRDRSIEMLDGFGARTLNTESLIGIMDSASDAQTGHGAGGQVIPSRLKAMNALGCRWKQAAKGPGSRVLGIQDLHRRLAPNPTDPQKRPGLIFFETCREAIRIFSAIQRDKDNPEDVDSNEEDHAVDSIRYGLQARPNSGNLRMTGW